MDGRDRANPSVRVVLERRRPSGLLTVLGVAALVGVVAFGVLARRPDPSADPHRPSTVPAGPTSIAAAPDPTTPSATSGSSDLTIIAVPEDAHPHVGERIWVDVSVTNHTSFDYSLTSACPAPIAVSVSDPGLAHGGPADDLLDAAQTFRTDGEPLRWVLERQRRLPFSVPGFEVDHTGRSGSTTGSDPCGDVAVSTALVAHSSVSSRQSVDLSTAGTLPPSGVLLLRVGVIAVSSRTGSSVVVERAIPLVVTDVPGRTSTWSAAVAATGEDARVLGWVMDVQGAVSDPAHGVAAFASYRQGAWEIWLTAPAGGGTVTSGAHLRVRTAPGSGAVLEVREIPAYEAPRDDPDATFTAPDRERVL